MADIERLTNEVRTRLHEGGSRSVTCFRKSMIGKDHVSLSACWSCATRSFAACKVDTSKNHPFTAYTIIPTRVREGGGAIVSTW